MKFNCSSQTLFKSIQVVEKAVSTRTTMPVLENIYFELNGPQLKLRANDLEIGIETTLNIENSEGSGSVLVKGKTISSIVSKLSNQALAVSIENQKVVLKTDKVDFDIHATSSDEYPVFPNIESGIQFQLSVSDLKDLIRCTIFAVSFDETKQFLNGILFKTDHDGLYFVSTDGYRLAVKKYILRGSVGAFSIIVPFKAVSELNKIIQNLDSDTQIDVNISDSQISFLMPNILLVSRLVQGQFPDYKQVLPKLSENRFLLKRRDLIDACDRASIIASSSNNVVKFLFSDDQLITKASSPSLGDFKEELDIVRQQGNGAAKIAFNVKLVLDVLKIIESDNVVVEFNSELSPCVIKPVDDEEYIYIIMPIRTSDYDVAVD